MTELWFLSNIRLQDYHDVIIWNVHRKLLNLAVRIIVNFRIFFELFKNLEPTNIKITQ